jgi:hypothetical protein
MMKFQGKEMERLYQRFDKLSERRSPLAELVEAQQSQISVA